MATAFAEGETFGRDLAVMVKSAINEAVAPLKSANEALQARVAELEARKPPEIDLTGVEKLIEVEIAKLPTPTPKPSAEIPVPKDGKDAANIVEALKDSGELVLTLQDGRLIRTGIRDGERGKDGRDGFSLEDFDCRVLEDDRTIEFSFKSGEHEHIATLKWPTTIDRGVWKEGQTYERGDAVTWAGSLWIAQEETTEKPDSGKGFRLAVKRGRDGRDRTIGDASK